MKQKYRFKDRVELSSDSWISYTDLMSGLVIILFLIVAVFISSNEGLTSEIDRLKEQVSRLEALNEELNKEKEEWYKADIEINSLLMELTKNINNSLAKAGKVGRVDFDRSNKTIHVDEKVLMFDKGKVNINSEYLENVAIIENELRKTLKKNINIVQEYIDTIFIEGNTDEDPVADDPILGNWKLSAGRASSFWRQITSNNNEKDFLVNLKSNRGTKLFSISGYADTRPNKCSNRGRIIFKNQCTSKQANLSSEASKSMDRRIDIRITPHHAESKSSRN